MKITTTPLEDHQVQLVVEVDDQELLNAKQKAARKIASKSKIPGFRPGKAPYQIIVRHVGEGAILEEAIETLANDIYPKALDESGIKPYGPGKLQNVNPTEPITLEFVVPLDAEVFLGNYHEVRLPYQKPEVSEDEVNEVLDDLRDRHAEIQTVDREARYGDQVVINIGADRVGDDENKEVLISERDTTIIINNDTEDANPSEWPYPGFSLELVGMKKGESKETTHTFSEDSTYEGLRGTKVSFQFSINEVSARKLPEMNDELARLVGNFDGLEELKREIVSSIENNKLSSYNSKYEEDLLNMIIADSNISYPPLMLDREIDNLVTNLENRLHSQGLDLDLYLKTRQMDITTLRDELKPDAEKNLARSLVIYELAGKEGITVSTDELQSETNRTVSSLSQMLPQNEVKKLSNKRVIGNIANNVMVDLLTRKTLETIREIGSGNYLGPVVDEETLDLDVKEEVENIPSIQNEMNDNSLKETENDE